MIDLTKHVSVAVMDLDEIRDRWPFQYDEEYREINLMDGTGNTQWSDSVSDSFLVGFRGDTLLFLLNCGGANARYLVRDTLPV